jgi:hypothetical protein
MSAQTQETQYIYIDTNGQKQGPVSKKELQKLALEGIIEPNTPVQASTGHKGVAGQLPDMLFKGVSPSEQKQVFCTNCGNAVAKNAVACMLCGAKPAGHRKFCQSCGAGVNPEQVVCTKCGAEIKEAAFPTSQAVQTVRAQAQQAAGSIFSWLFDFAFRDIRIHIVNLWATRIVYVICCFLAFLWGLWATYGCFQATEHIGPFVILAVPLVWLGIAFGMLLTRLYLEFFLVLIDWMVETTKAARFYIENNKRE